MKVLCITVGKKHDKLLVDAINDYEKRLGQYCDFSWQIVPSSDKATESSTIINLVKQDDIVILLDERGSLHTNEAIAAKLGSLQNNATKQLVIVIGGAYGVDQAVFDRSKHIVALSKQVFPHQLVRLLVAEQLYRCFNLLNGGKYHHQ